MVLHAVIPAPWKLPEEEGSLKKINKTNGTDLVLDLKRSDSVRFDIKFPSFHMLLIHKYLII